MNYWSADEITFLEANRQQPLPWLAQELGRSRLSVGNKLRRLQASGALPREPAAAAEKTCTRCGDLLPLDLFEVRVTARGARRINICRDCQAVPEDKGPPCDTCAMHDYCAKTGTTCKGFELYVQSGRTPVKGKLGWMVP